MLNLVRFAELANPGHGCDGMTGQEAYTEYGRRLSEIGDKFPGTPVWVGTAEATVIGPHDEQWDQVLLVHYETVSAFLEMIASPEYQSASPARTAAVADSRLILMHQSHPAS